jgi:hypothetical protein
LAALVVLAALILGVTAVTLPGCTLCHTSPAFVDQSAKNVHRKFACVQCHVQPGAASRVQYAYHMIFGMGLHLSPVGSGPVAGIPDNTCLSCHADVMKKVVMYNGISIKHVDCSKGRMCTDCHSDSAHGDAIKWPTVAQMNMCLDCHNADRVRTSCTTCHAARSMSARLTTGEWTVTHGPNWKQTHGMGNLKTCASCHPPDFCVRCHGIPMPHEVDFLRTHPIPALARRKDCTVCHTQGFCDACHRLPMPHPVSFAPTHPTIVRQLGQGVCLRCHVVDDCSNCHIKHIHPGGATLPPGSGIVAPPAPGGSGF